MVRVHVLGDLEVTVDGRRVDLGGPKPRALLAVLVAAAGRAVPVAQLVDQLWGSEPPARAEASLQSHVARLRRLLEPGRDARAPATVLRTQGGGYSLDLAEEDVDARRFVRLLREGREEEALELWHGTPYAGLACPSLEAEATRLEELRQGAVADLWRRRIDTGRPAGAVAELEHLVRQHPLRERLWGLLALALYRDSRQGEALAVLRRARHHLAEELGVDPGAELRELEAAVLRQDPALDPDTSVVTQAAAPPPPDPDPPSGRVLHGRASALALADQVLAEAAAGRGRTILVTGEPGIGKTRFAEELVRAARALGFHTGRGGWEAEECPTLWGWTRAVEEALGSAEVLRSDASDVTDAASASFRRAAALADAIRDARPVLLALDDVHWADTESLRLLRRVAAEASALPVVVVMLTRDSPGELGEPVTTLLADLARTDPLRIPLAGLDRADVAAWVQEQTGIAVPADAAGALVERTGGNPFFVMELVRLLVDEGALDHPGGAAWTRVPSGVRDVVAHRLVGLDPAVSEVAFLGAVAGRSFAVDVVTAAAEQDEAEVARAIETLQLVGLVEEEAPGWFRFSHALVRDAVHDARPAPARARAHAAIAAAIERCHGGRIAAHAAQLAEHYRCAGPAFARSGWVFARQAARQAFDRSDHDEAVRLFTDAVRLLDADPTAEPAEREEVLLGLVRALNRVARPVEAWPHVVEAATSALDRHDVPAAAAALTAVTEGLVWGWRRHPEYDVSAIELWERVLEALPRRDTLIRALLLAGLAAEMLYSPDPEERAVALAEEAVAVVRRATTSAAERLRVMRVASMAWLRVDLLHRRFALDDQVVELAAQVGDHSVLAAALTGRASDLSELGRLDAAHSDIVRAHELAEVHHLSQNLVVSGWCLAVRRVMAEDWVGAERAIAEGEAFQATLAMSGDGIGLALLSSLRELQGRLPELEQPLRETAPFHHGFRELHALALVRGGRTERARLLLGPWTEQPPLPRDYLWLSLMAIRAQVWIALGDRAALRDLRAALAPYDGRLAFAAAVMFCGSVRHTLGELDLALGDTGAAEERLRGARDEYAELGLPVWVARVEEALSRLAVISG